MEPQLSKVEALTEPGCYSLTFVLPGGAERALVARLREDEVDLPAQALDGWSPESPSFAAAVATLRAMQRARQLARPVGPRLHELEGGWDVGLGNVVLDHDGRPACVSHGALAPESGNAYRCAECGAGAGLG
ncbi:MAG: hypothetical protein ABI140_07230 [Jatrophihabitantaceae bacterium]